MRKPLVAGNWKMNGLQTTVRALAEAIKQGSADQATVDVAVLPSFLHLQEVGSILTHSRVTWGAQNLYLGKSGAFTGEVSGPMLADLGCRYVLIGHSERRHIFHEDLKLVAEKFKAAIEAGLQPILCVGETLTEREKNQTEAIIHLQLDSVIKLAGISAFQQTIIAYEPVWAIGTGLTATPEQAQEVHHYIREQLRHEDANIADAMRILYGGSVKADNAAGLFKMPDIDGGLIGGASLDAPGFLAICRAATK